jgi:hypothetical protein
MLLDARHDAFPDAVVPATIMLNAKATQFRIRLTGQEEKLS